MTNNIQAIHLKQRGRLIKSLVINMAATCLAVYLLIPAGPIFNSTRVDLSFLLLPITGYFVLRLASAFCLIYIISRAGYTAVYILRGAAAAFFLFWFFDKAILLTRITGLSGLQKFFSGLTEIDVFAVLFVFGATLSRVCGLYKMQTNEKYLGPLGISLGQLIMGFSLWRALGYYGLYWKPLEGIGLILMIGMSALALSTLSILGEKTRYTIFADFCTWLKASPTEKFFGGAALAAYLIFLRPLLFKYMPYAFLIEWTLLCLITWQIYRDIHNILRTRHTTVAIETDWQKHIQKIDDLIDEDFNKIGLLQRDFVELGSRRELLIYFKQVLLNNNLTEDQINDCLRDLIEYSDRKIRWYVIWIWRKRQVQNNLQNRKKALQNTIRNLSAIAHPVYTKNRSNI